MARKSRRPIIDAPAVSMPTGKAYNTAVYARLSIEDSGKADNGDSIDNQIYLVKQYVKERPYLIRQRRKNFIISMSAPITRGIKPALANAERPLTRKC